MSDYDFQKDLQKRMPGMLASIKEMFGENPPDLIEELLSEENRVTEHSPLPWKAYEELDGTWSIDHCANGSVATDGLSKLDAELIVTAVNSHRRLIEALGTLHDMAEPFGRHSKYHERSKQAFDTAAALLKEFDA